MSTEVDSTIPVSEFRNVLLSTLEEASNNVHGFFLDKGTSLFETLAGISAAEASTPLGPGSGTIAAKVNHIRFYFDVVLTNAKVGEYVPADWESSWALNVVNETEWQELVERTRLSIEEFRELATTNQVWPEPVLVGAFGVLTHMAYHLGEIRQALAQLAINPVG